MDSKERVKRTIEFNSPDRPPICGGPYSDIVRICGYENWLETDWKYNDTLKKYERRDEWGCIHRIGEINGSHYHVETNPLRDWSALETYRFPSTTNIDRKLPKIKEYIEKEGKGEKYVEAAMDPGPYLVMTNLKEHENMLMDFHLNMPKIIELYSRIVDYYITMVEKLKNVGVHCVTFYEDWGTTRGMICSPQMWEKNFKPVSKRLIDSVHDLGLHFGWQVSGNVGEELLRHMADMGVDLLDEYQPNLKGIDVLGKTLRGKVCLLTCIDGVKTFERGTPEDVEKEANLLIEKMDCNGAGLIFRPNHPGQNPSPEIIKKINVLHKVVHSYCRLPS